MRTKPHSLTALILSLLFFSCAKNANKKEDVLRITPESVVSYAGTNWSSISSEFSSKKDYQYSALNNGNILAAISLPAKDDGAPARDFKLLLNINQEKRVTAVILQSTDSLNVTTGNQLFLYYYEKAFSLVHNAAYISAIDNYDQQVNIGVENLVTELKGLNCAQASLTYQNDVMNINAGFYRGTFSVNIFAP
ncbi:MAG: hypothetical protein ACTHM7_20230 [Ginsengibacter sp.]